MGNMKFYNKKRGRKDWTEIRMDIWRESPQNIKVWCQQYPSDGKFYYYCGYVELSVFGFPTIWFFEKKEDALYFKFKWC